MQRVVLIIIFVFALLGCKNHFLSPNFKQEYFHSASLLFIDTIKISVLTESASYFWQTDLLDNRFLYGFSPFSPSPLTMSVFDLQEKQFLQVIDFDKNLLNATRIDNFKVVSSDSILIATWPNRSIFLTDGSGKILSAWNNDDLAISGSEDEYVSKTDFSISNNSYLENMTYDRNTMLIYLPLDLPYDAALKEHIPAKRHGVYNTSLKKWQALYGAYEGTLKRTNGGRYFYDMEYSYQLITKDYIYITYPADHSVYIYNNGTFQLERSLDISPSMATKTPEPLYGIDANDDGKLNKLRRTAPFYGPLYYHDAIDKFSRFYNEAAKENKPAQRVLIIYDARFNILEERTFSLQQISHIQPSPTGFIIQPYNTMDADRATFVRVEIIDK